jgi:hypothetical protein
MYQYMGFLLGGSGCCDAFVAWEGPFLFLYFRLHAITHLLVLIARRVSTTVFVGTTTVGGQLSNYPIHLDLQLRDSHY